MNIQLFPLREEETIAFKEEMQEAFQHENEHFGRKSKENETRTKTQ